MGTEEQLPGSSHHQFQSKSTSKDDITIPHLHSSETSSQNGQDRSRRSYKPYVTAPIYQVDSVLMLTMSLSELGKEVLDKLSADQKHEIIALVRQVILHTVPHSSNPRPN